MGEKCRELGVHSGGCYGYTVEGVMGTQCRVLWGT